MQGITSGMEPKDIVDFKNVLWNVTKSVISNQNILSLDSNNTNSSGQEDDGGGFK